MINSYSSESKDDVFVFCSSLSLFSLLFQGHFKFQNNIRPHLRKVLITVMSLGLNKATTKTKVEKQKLIDNRRQLHVLFLPKVLILL